MKEKCFVIMPIGELETYPENHFKHVYEDILCPAIQEAGYIPKRADEDKSSNMIQASIIRDIIEAPMAVCDLSTRNPNVLFELGIRQAFDLPVVLIQEENTPRIFDISSINTLDYRKELIYREVIEDREKIVAAIRETKDNKRGINSIIKLLKLGNAQIDDQNRLSENEKTNILLYSLLNRMERIENEVVPFTTQVKKNKLIESESDRERRIAGKINLIEREIMRAYEKHGEKEAEWVAKENSDNINIDSSLSEKERQHIIESIEEIKKIWK